MTRMLQMSNAGRITCFLTAAFFHRPWSALQLRNLQRSRGDVPRKLLVSASEKEVPRKMNDGREEDMLTYVWKNAARGDSVSVLKAIDNFAWNTKWMMNIGDRKVKVLTDEVIETTPKIVVELGAYCGYSAVSISRLLEPGARLLSLELDPKFAAIAAQVVDYAGLSDKVTFVTGPADQSLKQLKSKYGIDHVDLFFFDHWKDRYLPDLKTVLECGLLQHGSVIVADNVIYPGTPDYLSFIRAHPHFKSTFHAAQLEYRTDVEDGIEVSVYIAR